jgi:uroporphyrin-III C-methyltransferase
VLPKRDDVVTSRLAAARGRSRRLATAMAMPARSSASASAPRAVDVRARRRRTRDGGRRATVRPTATRDGDARARARDENEASTSMGSVCLVGAGPGGVDALTMGAARALANADVVVYDDLGGSSEDVLALATKANAEFVSVGKRGGSAKSWTQSDICELLVELARSGKRVARLKGGCPSVFARVSDEIAALRKHGVHTTMIPGISSALSAPLSVGIPLTDRELGRHFSVTSAHDPNSIDFAAFAGIDTCVFLMVGRTLPIVVESLTREGNKSPTTPCCVIRNGMQPDERSWFGSLRDIVEKTSGESLSPCILVVGNVVTLA